MGKKLYPAMVMMLAMVFIATLLFVEVLHPANINDVNVAVAGGRINWTDRYIEVAGSGAPNPDLSVAAGRLGAIRAAKLDAMRNALEAIKGVQIDSQTTVRNAMLESDVIRSQVTGYIRGVEVVGETKYLSDGSVQVKVRVSLEGYILNTLLPKDMGTKPVPKSGNPVFTGLIINAKGLKVRPALSPKVFDEDGREVYGSAFVSREYAVEQGMVGYAKDLSAAQQNDRVTDNPLIVKAKKTTGSGGSDIVISNEDSQFLRDTSKNLSFIEQCRVMIIVD